MKTYRDHYFERAKQEQYPARSVYKLQEMDRRFTLLRRGMKVLDLGAAPGSWTLYAARRVGPGGRVLAVDLQTLREALAPEFKDLVFPANVQFRQEDVFAPSPDFSAELEAARGFDLVMSDMAPRTTGVQFADQARSLELALQALSLARQWLLKEGRFVVKVFMGPDSETLRQKMRPCFREVKAFKPKSSRAESKEIFFLGLGFLGPTGEPEGSPASVS